MLFSRNGRNDSKALKEIKAEPGEVHCTTAAVVKTDISVSLTEDGYQELMDIVGGVRHQTCQFCIKKSCHTVSFD